MNKHSLVSFIVTLVDLILHVHGSGSLYDPPNRAVMWKYGYRTRKNYSYMQLNCGGDKQLENGPFKCGICGDKFDAKREHEKGGKYGTGTISRYYPAGIKEMSVKIELLAFEKGHFEFRLCSADQREVTQECLDENILPIKEGYLEGTPLRFYPKGAGDFRLTVAVPPNMTCDRCVLQWRYHTANSWGVDPITQEQGMGIGPQEEFRNCADIRIGGPVPRSVRLNPFFAPPDASQASTIDKPTDQRKRLASSNSLTIVAPEVADQLSPEARLLLNGVQVDGSMTQSHSTGQMHDSASVFGGRTDNQAITSRVQDINHGLGMGSKNDLTGALGSQMVQGNSKRKIENLMINDSNVFENMIRKAFAFDRGAAIASSQNTSGGSHSAGGLDGQALYIGTDGPLSTSAINDIQATRNKQASNPSESLQFVDGGISFRMKKTDGAQKRKTGQLAGTVDHSQSQQGQAMHSQFDMKGVVGPAPELEKKVNILVEGASLSVKATGTDTGKMKDATRSGLALSGGGGMVASVGAERPASGITDGTQINTLTDKLNSNFDTMSSFQNVAETGGHTSMAGNNKGNLDMGVQSVSAKHGAFKGLQTATSTGAAQEAINAAIKSSGQNILNEPPLSISSLTPSSDRQRIFLLRASRPNGSIEGHRREMTLSESLQPETGVLHTTFDKTSSHSAGIMSNENTGNIQTEQMSPTIRDIAGKTQLSNIPSEMILNSLNEVSKTDTVASGPRSGMITSEVIDPLRTQVQRSDGTVAMESQFLSSGNVKSLANKKAEVMPDNVNLGSQGTVINDVDAFRNELVKSSLRQGGALKAEKAVIGSKPQKDVATGAKQTVKQKDTVSIGGTSLLASNEVGRKTASPSLDQTVSDLLNEAQRILGSTADITGTQTASVTDTVAKGSTESTKPVVESVIGLTHDALQPAHVESHAPSGAAHTSEHVNAKIHTNIIGGSVDHVPEGNVNTASTGQVSIHDPPLLTIDYLLGDFLSGASSGTLSPIDGNLALHDPVGLHGLDATHKDQSGTHSAHQLVDAGLGGSTHTAGIQTNIVGDKSGVDQITHVSGDSSAAGLVDHSLSKGSSNIVGTVTNDQIGLQSSTATNAIPSGSHLTHESADGTTFSAGVHSNIDVTETGSGPIIHQQGGTLPNNAHHLDLSRSDGHLDIAGTVATDHVGIHSDRPINDIQSGSFATHDTVGLDGAHLSSGLHSNIAGTETGPGQIRHMPGDTFQNSAMHSDLSMSDSHLDMTGNVATDHVGLHSAEPSNNFQPGSFATHDTVGLDGTHLSSGLHSNVARTGTGSGLDRNLHGDLLTLSASQLGHLMQQGNSANIGHVSNELTGLQTLKAAHVNPSGSHGTHGTAGVSLDSSNIAGTDTGAGHTMQVSSDSVPVSSSIHDVALTSQTIADAAHNAGGSSTGRQNSLHGFILGMDPHADVLSNIDMIGPNTGFIFMDTSPGNNANVNQISTKPHVNEHAMGMPSVHGSHTDTARDTTIRKSGSGHIATTSEHLGSSGVKQNTGASRTNVAGEQSHDITFGSQRSIQTGTNSIGTANKATPDQSSNINTGPSNQIGGNIIDFTQTGRSRQRQNQIGTNVNDIGKLATHRQFGQVQSVLPDIVDLSGLSVTGPGLDLSPGTSSEGTSSSSSRERLNQSVLSGSAGRGRQRIIGRNNIVNRVGQAGATTSADRSRAGGGSIEQQINSLSLENIPNGNVIGAGIQMRADGGMTAGFGPRREVTRDSVIEERRVISRENRRHDFVRGDQTSGPSEGRVRMFGGTGAGSMAGSAGRLRGSGSSGSSRVSQDSHLHGSGTSSSDNPAYFLDMSGGVPLDTPGVERTFIRELPSTERAVNFAERRGMDLSDSRRVDGRGTGSSMRGVGSASGAVTGSSGSLRSNSRQQVMDQRGGTGRDTRRRSFDSSSDRRLREGDRRRMASDLRATGGEMRMGSSRSTSEPGRMFREGAFGMVSSPRSGTDIGAMRTGSGGSGPDIGTGFRRGDSSIGARGRAEGTRFTTGRMTGSGDTLRDSRRRVDGDRGATRFDGRRGVGDFRFDTGRREEDARMGRGGSMSVGAGAGRFRDGGAIVDSSGRMEGGFTGDRRTDTGRGMEGRMDTDFARGSSADMLSRPMTPRGSFSGSMPSTGDFMSGSAPMRDPFMPPFGAGSMMSGSGMMPGGSFGGGPMGFGSPFGPSLGRSGFGPMMGSPILGPPGMGSGFGMPPFGPGGFGPGMI